MRPLTRRRLRAALECAAGSAAGSAASYMLVTTSAALCFGNFCSAARSMNTSSGTTVEASVSRWMPDMLSWVHPSIGRLSAPDSTLHLRWAR